MLNSNWKYIQLTAILVIRSFDKRVIMKFSITLSFSYNLQVGIKIEIDTLNLFQATRL